MLNKLEIPRIINPSLAEFDTIMEEKRAKVDVKVDFDIFNFYFAVILKM